MIKSLQRTREYTGPTPHAVAIVARPTSKKPAEHLILERRRMEDTREKTLAETKYNKQCDLKSAWEKATDKKITKNKVKREIQWYLMQEKVHLEERRDRLREMLLAEEQQFIQEMELKEETLEERQEKMRVRANFLKQKRESERLALVEEKLDQRFREECEELRSTLSKRNRDEIFQERQEQLSMKHQLKNNEEEIEKFYADLWAKDIESKAKREEEETLQQMERNKDMLEVLNLQKAALLEQKNDEKQLKQLEAEWLKEEADLRKYEEEKLKDAKKLKQLASKRARDVSVKLKRRKEAKEKQEQLAMDMKILEQILEETKNEAMEDKNRKANMRLETQRFMHYMDMTRKEETEREQELERLVNIEVQKQWDKRDGQKQLEKTARKTLMQNVLQTREKQIVERDEIFRKEQIEAMRERKELLQQMEEHRKLESERLDRIRKVNKKYQKDLEQQIQFERLQKDREIKEARKELETMQDAEKHYQRRLKSALDRPDTRRHHPLRISGLGYTSRATSC